MNLKHLNLDLYGIPKDAKIQIPVFLISEDLKARKLFNGLLNIGGDACFCVGELCDVVLAYMEFDDPPDDLYGFYFDLLDRYCEKVSRANNKPIKEALKIYNELMHEKEKRMITTTKHKHDAKKRIKRSHRKQVSISAKRPNKNA